MLVPEFKQYYPSEGGMNSSQLKFYKTLENQLSKGIYLDIDGNISYVFTFIYKIISKYKEENYKFLSDYLIYLSEIYSHEKSLSEYCLSWAYDCLLGLGKYEDFLEKTEAHQITGTSTHNSNLRLNIQYHIVDPGFRTSS